MKKIKRAIRWAAANSFFAWMLWAGFVGGVTGAHHIAVFIVWFSFFGSWLVFSKDVAAKLRADGPSVPMAMDMAFDLCVVGFLVWHGSAVLGTIYLLHSILLHGTYARATETAHV